MTIALTYAKAFAAPGDPRLPRLLSEIGRIRSAHVMRQAGIPSHVVAQFENHIRKSANPAAWSPEMAIADRLVKDGRLDLAALQMHAFLAHLGLDLGDEAGELTGDWIYYGGTFVRAGKGGSSARANLSVLPTGPTQQMSAHPLVFASSVNVGWPAYPPAKGVKFGLTETGVEVEADSFPNIWEYPAAQPRAADCSALAIDVQHFYESVRLLHLCSDIHATWVDHLVRQVMLATLKGTTADTSGSTMAFPAIIYLNPHPTPLLTAEALVHEASHVALGAASCISPLIEPGTDEMHYSPIKGIARPLELVLYAAHATINTAVFLRRAEVAIGLKQAERRQLDTWKEWHATYSKSIASAKTLTKFGREIWRESSEAYQKEFRV